MLAAFELLLLFVPAQVGALVELKLPSDCEAAFSDFQAGVRASVVGMPSSDRSARVVIDRRAARYRLEISTQGDAASRTKRLSTASCEEAAAAATAVLALALSEPAAASTERAAAGTEPATAGGESAAFGGTPATASAAPVTSSSEPAHAGGMSAAVSSKPSTASRDSAAGSGEAAASSNRLAAANKSARESVYGRRVRPGSVDATANANRDEPSTASQPVRFALRAGIDTGTLTSATGYLGALAAIPAGPFEWRALVAYGLPSVEERIDPGISELRREHFLLVDLGGCYGFGVRVWLAACAAGELNVVQRTRVLDDVSDERVGVRVAEVLAAHVAYRGSRLQPEFELGAAATALGTGDAGPLALRASFGLGLQF